MVKEGPFRVDNDMSVWPVACSRLSVVGGERKRRASVEKSDGETKASEGRRACKHFFNDPLPPTFGLMRYRKVKIPTCQLAGNVLQFLA